MVKLHKYQQGASDFALKHKSTYQMLDMGMGKTAIAIDWTKRIPKNARGTLVIAPLSTIYSSWPDELELWAPELKVTILHGKNKGDGLTDKSDIYLINFEGIQWLFERLKEHFAVTKSVPFRSIVIDEGSMVKSHSTKRFKILQTLIEIFPKYRMILSGTPAPNTLQDLWSQYYLLDKGQSLGRNISAFRNKYMIQVDRMGYIHRLKKGAKDKIYEHIKPMTFRLDAKDYLTIPDRLDNTIKVKLPQASLDKYKALESDFYTALDEENVTAFSVPALAMKLRQFVQGCLYVDVDPSSSMPKNGSRPFIEVHQAKLKALRDIVENSGGKGILCPIQFRFELEVLQKAFPKASVIAGGTSAAQAGKLIKLWNQGSIPLLICHPMSIGHGVNLQAGSNIIVWYGLTWSAEQYAQLNGRLHRQGQKHKVIIHHLVCTGTIDEQIIKALSLKIKGQKDMLDYLRVSRRIK